MIRRAFDRSILVEHLTTLVCYHISSQKFFGTLQSQSLEQKSYHSMNRPGEKQKFENLKFLICFKNSNFA